MVEVRQNNASIVVIGHLNPWIFQPEWLREHKIVGQDTAEASKTAPNQFMHSEITQLDFRTIKLLVDSRRFAVTCIEEPLIRAKDFAVACFSLLAHTPVQMVGMNRTTRLRLANKENWHSLGDKLAPKNPWEALFASSLDIDRTGGLRSLTMELSRRPDELQGYIRVKVDSLTIPEISIDVNDHINLITDGVGSTGEELCKVIEEHWDASMERAERIIDSIAEQSDGK